LGNGGLGRKAHRVSPCFGATKRCNVIMARLWWLGEIVNDWPWTMQKGARMKCALCDGE
jgi:hypothetical protein